jgi:hypothetical protein
MNQKAEVFPRILAFMIDVLIAWLPFLMERKPEKY